MKKATFGAGCFWCIEACYKELSGVYAVTAGYAGGHIENPSYEVVSEGNTGHAEIAHLEYDPTLISYQALLEVFFFVHNPTHINRQGDDIGSQYRSVIFYHDEEQKAMAIETIKNLNQSKAWDADIVTELSPYTNHFQAESYHNGYLENNPESQYCKSVVRPKYDKFKFAFSKMLK
jgi:peptide-methionine (S)-S-oxide reductase